MQVFFLQSCPSNSNLLVRVYWVINSKYYIYRDMQTASIMFCSFCSSICIGLVGWCTQHAMWCLLTHGPVPLGSPYPGCASLIHRGLGLALGILWDHVVLGHHHHLLCMIINFFMSETMQMVVLKPLTSKNYEILCFFIWLQLKFPLKCGFMESFYSSYQ